MSKKDSNQQIEKVVVNSGIGRLAISNLSGFEEKILPKIVEDFAKVTGQKPLTVPAKKSIAGFKLRQGQIVGLKSTLRRQRKSDFLERLVNIILPRVRDFRGIDLKNVDKSGNLSIGIKDVIAFPEYIQDVGKLNFGVEITIVPRVKNREKAMDIYRGLKIPFKN